jgi:hypothetical protein
MRRPQARYFAFLSYSHKDEDLAEWLHSQLEQFRVPRALAGQLSEHGVIPKLICPDSGQVDEPLGAPSVTKGCRKRGEGQTVGVIWSRGLHNLDYC